MQTGMPGYSGRVAWVRQRPNEGGGNLFMPREIIASLALRGALAGARLTRRFGDDAQWNRHRWLRLRIALDSLQKLRAEVTEGLSAANDLLTHMTASSPGIDPSLLTDGGPEPHPSLRQIPPM